MPVPTWRKWLNRATRPSKRPRASRRPPPALLHLEELENRLTPSVTFLNAPSTGTAGQALSPVVQVQVTARKPLADDPVTLSVASGPGAFAFTSTTTATTDANGVASFSNLVLDAAGDYTFQATDSVLGETSSPSSITTIAPGPASQVFIGTEASQVSEGQPVEFVVGAADQFGNPAAGSTIHFSSSTTQAQLPPDFTFQAGDYGVQFFEAAFTVPGTQTITATVLGSTVSATASIEVQAVAPQDVQLKVSASDAPINQPITLSGSFTDPGTLDANTLDINWDDGSADTILVLPAQVRSFNAAHTYTAEGDYYPTVSISNPDGGTSEDSSEVQALAGPIDDVADVSGQPGQTVVSSVTDANSDSISATLSLSPNDAKGGRILVAKLADASLPSTTNRADVLRIYDIRFTSQETGDSVVVTFRFRAGSDTGHIPVLQYLNPATGKLEDFVPGKSGSFELTRQGDFIIGRLVLDNTSTPRLRELNHTVFTVSASVPSASATASVSAPVASTDSNAVPAVSTATFLTTSQLTLTLEPTQAGQVSSSLSSFDATSSGGSSVVFADPAAALYSFLADEVGDGVKALLPFGTAALRNSHSAGGTNRHSGGAVAFQRARTDHSGKAHRSPGSGISPRRLRFPLSRSCFDHESRKYRDSGRFGCGSSESP